MTLNTVGFIYCLVMMVICCWIDIHSKCNKSKRVAIIMFVIYYVSAIFLSVGK